MRSPRSLLSFAAVASAAAILVSLAALGAFRRIVDPSVPLGKIAADILAPAAIAGTAAAAAVLAVFRTLVLRPLSRIGRHLYDVGMGRLRPLSVRSAVLEVRPLIDGVNLLVRKLEPPSGPGAGIQFLEIIESLRDVARAIAPASPERAAEILDDIAVLERAFLSGARTRPISPACV